MVTTLRTMSALCMLIRVSYWGHVMTGRWGAAEKCQQQLRGRHWLVRSLGLVKSEMTETTIIATVSTKVNFWVSLPTSGCITSKKKKAIQWSQGAIGWLFNDLLFVCTVPYSNTGLYWLHVWETPGGNASLPRWSQWRAAETETPFTLRQQNDSEAGILKRFFF